VKRYDGQDVEIVYDPGRCIHAAECVKGLPQVFDPERRPWIDPSGANAAAVAEVVARCPTGALHAIRKDGGPDEAPPPNGVLVAENGPLYAHGRVIVENNDGAAIVRDTRVALCRCGESKRKPHCDGAHTKAGFEAPGCGDPTARPNHPTATDDDDLQITALPDGPLLVSGTYELRTGDEEFELREGGALCRCGASGKKPFCDGSHRRIGFEAE